MTRFGETADKILEMLQHGEMKITELKNKIYLRDSRILDFLEEYGLVEIDRDYVSITRSGMELLTAK